MNYSCVQIKMSRQFCKEKIVVNSYVKHLKKTIGLRKSKETKPKLTMPLHEYYLWKLTQKSKNTEAIKISKLLWNKIITIYLMCFKTQNTVEVFIFLRNFHFCYWSCLYFRGNITTDLSTLCLNGLIYLVKWWRWDKRELLSYKNFPKT